MSKRSAQSWEQPLVPVTAEEVAAHFRRDVAELLETRTRIGQARRLPGDRYAA